MTYPFGNQRWNEKTKKDAEMILWWIWANKQNIFDQHCLSFLEKGNNTSQIQEIHKIWDIPQTLWLLTTTLGQFYLGTSLSQSATLAIIVVDLKRFYDFFRLSSCGDFWWLFDVFFEIARKRGNWHQPQI